MIILTKDNGRITVEDKVVQKSILMLAERSNVGVKKYGTTLEDNDDDDFLQHLAEELGDGLNYIMKIKRQEENLINPEDFLEESSFEKKWIESNRITEGGELPYFEYYDGSDYYKLTFPEGISPEHDQEMKQYFKSVGGTDDWPDNEETDYSVENVRLSVDVLIGKQK